MSSIFTSPKVSPVVVEKQEPQVVDNSDKVQEEEKRRKKKQGAAAHFLQNSVSASQDTVKTTLGA